ncbi:MAG: squalene/phytoene synthase family protein [Gammaproteobacteria bacterium]|nr:squalene/phytoene synthase family protein [Gammaproteobacteria bacterium]
MENEIQYCYKKIAPVGSAFYYSVLKVPASERDAIVAIAAFYQELIECLYECKEPALAQVKLNWWRLEVSKLSLGHPEHPVSQVLQKNLPAFNLSPQAFADMIDGVEENLSLAPFPTVEDVMIHIMRTAGIRETLIATVAQRTETVDPETIYQLTLVLELAQLMQNLRRDVRAGLILFGEDELAKYHVAVSDLQHFKTTPAIRELLAFQVEKAELAYQKAIKALSPKGCLLNASLIIRCQAALKLMHEMQVSQFPLLENFITLTALRNWWIAHRTYRKLKKNRLG